MFFLLHHAVVKQKQKQPNVVVFSTPHGRLDARLSVNQAQCVGPVFESNLFTMLLKFRMHRFIFLADIAQMYRQIWIHPNGRRFQNYFGETTQMKLCNVFN